MSTLSWLGRSTAMAAVFLSLAGCAPMIDPQGSGDTMSQIISPGEADKAMSALTRGDYVGAERLAIIALRKNSRDPTALVVAGMAYQGQGRYDLARQYYEVIITTQVPGAIMAPGDGGVVMQRSIIDVAKANMALVDKITGRNFPRSAAESGRPPGASAVGGPSFPTPDYGQGMYPGGARPSVSTGGLESLSSTGSPIRVSDAETNVAGRFKILKRLLDDGLITADEFARRRATNAGAMLPYTMSPGAAGLERPIPSEDAVATRLRDLIATLETRAITPSQHAAERGVILDALLPEKPKRVENPPLPPRDMLEAGQLVGRLERLRAAGLISAEEAQKERAAIERHYETVMGAHQVAGTATGTRTAPAAAAAATNGKAKGKWGVALSKAGSEEEAQAVWDRMKAKYPEDLAKLGPIFKKVESADKPTYYRVIAGPVTNKAAATKLCKTMVLYRQSCDPASY